MHYPFWYVPGLTSPMWIAVVAVIHVFLAMYAVGGSILLAYQTRLAYKLQDTEYLRYLRDHAWFFIVITLVFSSLLGVGIWWTIGLASPLATEDLIHIFVLAWAMEYVSFLIEILSAFIFFYYWGRLDAKTHQQIGWIYAGAAVVSLVIITAITAFQLNSGGWEVGDGLLKALFNPQAIPQIIARLGGSLLLGALYFFLHSAFKIRNNEALHHTVLKESSRWAILGSVLTAIGGILWYVMLPPSASASLVGAAVLNVLVVIIFLLTIAVAVMMYIGPFKSPSWVSPGFALLFFGLGHIATGTGEFIREAVRKPYIVYGRVLGNQVRVEELPKIDDNGYLNSGVWTKAYIKDRFPEVISGGKIDDTKLLKLPPNKRRAIGKTIFMYHCNDCHSTEGYSAVSQLTRGWDRYLIHTTITHLDDINYSMPPWGGTDAEADLLTDYLLSIRKPYPEGLFPEEDEAK